MPLTVNQVFRDYNTAGVPASGDFKPRKSEIRTLLKSMQDGTSAVGDYRGAWSNVTAYVATDLVESGGSIWYALVDNTNVTPVEGANWTLFLPGVSVADGAITLAKLSSELVGFFAITPQGRLTLTSGVGLTTSDVVGAISVYYTPFAGALVPIWDGTEFVPHVFTELSLPLDANSGHVGYHSAAGNFDLFIFNDAGTLRLGSGPSWAVGGGSTTARGSGAGSTELELKNGVWTNTQAITLRFGSASGNTVVVADNSATFVGTFAASANGQATDSADRRLLGNAYNVAPRPVRRTDPAVSVNYSAAIDQPVNADVNNCVDLVCPLDGMVVEIVASLLVENNDATPRSVSVAIGSDTTTAYPQALRNRQVIINQQTTLMTHYKGSPGLGRRRFHWLYQGAGAGTQTWFLNGSYPVGMIGSVLS